MDYFGAIFECTWPADDVCCKENQISLQPAERPIAYRVAGYWKRVAT